MSSKYRDGDAWREYYHDRIVKLLYSSNIDFIEIWDYNLTSSTVSMLLTGNRKARYYFLLGYLVVYHYTDDTLTYVDRLSSFRLDNSSDKLEPFTPLIEQVNDLIQKARSDFFYTYIGASAEERINHKAYTLFVHTLPPYTEDDSDQLIDQSNITEFSTQNPIQFAEYFNSVIVYKDEKYIARSKTYHLVYPLSISTILDTHTRNAHYVQTVIYRFDQIDFKIPGLAFAIKRVGKDRKRDRHNFEYIQSKRVKNSFTLTGDGHRAEEACQEIRKESMHVHEKG